MDLFLDSSNPKEILEARSWGLLAGVTTNPSLIAAAGPDPEKTLDALLDASPGPLLVQVVGWHTPEPMVRQARWLHARSPRIIVKLPASVAGLQALQQLKTELPSLRLAVTAKAGADIAAIFNGPLDQAEDVPHDLISPIRQIYTRYGFTTKILACGRYPRLFGEIALAGADLCTLRMEFMRLLYEHPFTEQRMNGFLKSWQGTFGEESWPELP